MSGDSKDNKSSSTPWRDYSRGEGPKPSLGIKKPDTPYRDAARNNDDGCFVL